MDITGHPMTLGGVAAHGAAIASLAAAAVHVAVLPAHADVSGLHAIGFDTAAALQVGVAVGLVLRALMYESADPDAAVTGLAYVVRRSPSQRASPAPTTTGTRTARASSAAGWSAATSSPRRANASAPGNRTCQTCGLLHVWVAPGYENPDGVFRHHHPDINPAR